MLTIGTSTLWNLQQQAHHHPKAERLARSILCIKRTRTYQRHSLLLQPRPQRRPVPQPHHRPPEYARKRAFLKVRITFHSVDTSQHPITKVSELFRLPVLLNSFQLCANNHVCLFYLLFV